MIDYKTGKVRDEKPGAAAGRADAAAAAVRARRREAARDRPRARARPRTSTRRARASSSIDRRGRPRSSPNGTSDVIGAARARSSTGSLAGDFMIAPWKADERLRATATSTRSARGASRRLRQAQGRRRAARPARDRDQERRVSAAASIRRRASGSPTSSTRTSASRPAPGPARRPCSSSGSSNLLASGRVTVDQLVVITFTEKAAAELSTRVRDALERRAAAGRRARSASGWRRRRATSTGRTSRRSTASRRRCCASARSRRGSTRCSKCVEGSPAASTSTPPTSASRTSCCPRAAPSSNARSGAGFGLDGAARGLRAASTSTATCCRSSIPARRGRRARTAPSPSSRRDRRRARRRCSSRDRRATTGRVPIVEGIIEWVDRARGARHRCRAGVRAALPTRGRHAPERRLEGELGRAASRGLKELQEALPRRARRGAGRAARPTRCWALLPQIEQFVDDYERQRTQAGERRLRRPAVLGARPAARRASRRATTSAGASGPC